MEQVPVFCEAYGGFGDLRGVLQFDGDRLVLRYQTADSLFGVVRSEPKRLEFSLADVGRARYGAGWFWLMPVIELPLSDFDVLAQLPIKHEGCLRLRVKFGDRRLAERLVDELNIAASEQRFRRLDQELDRLHGRDPADEAARAQPRRQDPPPEPPVRDDPASQ